MLAPDHFKQYQVGIGTSVCGILTSCIESLRSLSYSGALDWAPDCNHICHMRCLKSLSGKWSGKGFILGACCNLHIMSRGCSDTANLLGMKAQLADLILLSQNWSISYFEPQILLDHPPHPDTRRFTVHWTKSTFFRRPRSLFQNVAPNHCSEDATPLKLL